MEHILSIYYFYMEHICSAFHGFFVIFWKSVTVQCMPPVERSLHLVCTTFQTVLDLTKEIILRSGRQLPQRRCHVDGIFSLFSSCANLSSTLRLAVIYKRPYVKSIAPTAPPLFFVVKTPQFQQVLGFTIYHLFRGRALITSSKISYFWPLFPMLPNTWAKLRFRRPPTLKSVMS